MAGGNLLSDAALEQVRQVVRQVTGDVRGNRNLPTQPIAQGPECFFAKTPAGGIPGRAGDVLGNADCDLYKAVIQSAGSDVRTFVKIADSLGNAKTRIVHNLSTTAVAGNVYILIARTKLGTWTVIVEEC